MLNYERVRQQPTVFKCMTGMTVEAFDRLVRAFMGAYEADLDSHDQARAAPRQRRRGGGRTSAIPTHADKLLFILCYLRLYPTQALQGFFFGLSQPEANAWIQRLLPILSTALGDEAQLPARQASDLQSILAACPGLEFLIDGTERPIQRPQDPPRQRQYYSGKKKRHTVKNNVVTDKRSQKIVGLSDTVEGKQHDKKVADDQQIPFPAGSSLWKDTGFQGYEPEHTTTFQPKKKPKGGTLTAEERAINQAISRVRIAIEHTIGGVKLFRIVSDVYRNRKAGLEDLVMLIACGLHNFRVDHVWGH
jgi:DDE superfamily endonuclease/Helix-turn-helix of DDE superfamily endonuclease